MNDQKTNNNATSRAFFSLFFWQFVLDICSVSTADSYILTNQKNWLGNVYCQIRCTAHSLRFAVKISTHLIDVKWRHADVSDRNDFVEQIFRLYSVLLYCRISNKQYDYIVQRSNHAETSTLYMYMCMIQT